MFEQLLIILDPNSYFLEIIHKLFTYHKDLNWGYLPYIHINPKHYRISYLFMRRQNKSVICSRITAVRGNKFVGHNYY